MIITIECNPTIYHWYSLSTHPAGGAGNAWFARDCSEFPVNSDSCNGMTIELGRHSTCSWVKSPHDTSPMPRGDHWFAEYPRTVCRIGYIDESGEPNIAMCVHSSATRKTDHQFCLSLLFINHISFLHFCRYSNVPRARFAFKERENCEKMNHLLCKELGKECLLLVKMLYDGCVREANKFTIFS